MSEDEPIKLTPSAIDVMIEEMKENKMGKLWYEDVMTTRYGYIPPLYHDKYLVEENFKQRL